MVRRQVLQAPRVQGESVSKTGRTAPGPWPGAQKVSVMNQGAPHMRPGKQGLYDPQFEHDACGVGFVVDMKGRKSHMILAAGHPDAAQPRPPRRVRLRDQHRRRRRRADPDAARASSQGGRKAARIALPAPGEYGVGLVFLPRDPIKRAPARGALRADRPVRGARPSSAGGPCPPTTRSLGETARAVRAVDPAGLHRPRLRRSTDPMAFERKLYVIRKLAYNEIRASTHRRRGVLVRAEPVVQDHHLQGHAAAPSSSRSTSPT